MHKLGVNIDHVATLRQARMVTYPDPVYAAMIAENSGASNITIHIREDRRHAQDRDLEIMKQTINIKLNLEMAATDDLLNVALKMRPDSATLVPEKREELTTEGGLNLISETNSYMGDYISKLKEAGIEVSIFIDPDREQVKKSLEMGADAVEFNTGKYSESTTEDEMISEAEKVKIAVEYALSLGLKAHVGHGLNYNNIHHLAKIEGIEEFNIGHAIVAKSVFVGFDRAVKEMLALIK